MISSPIVPDGSCLGNELGRDPGAMTWKTAEDRGKTALVGSGGSGAREGPSFEAKAKATHIWMDIDSSYEPSNMKNRSRFNCPRSSQVDLIGDGQMTSGERQVWIWVGVYHDPKRSVRSVGRSESRRTILVAEPPAVPEATEGASGERQHERMEEG